MNLTIPSSLIAFYRSLPWDDRGILCELPAGGYRTWGNTHTHLGARYTNLIDQYGSNTNAGALGKIMLYDRQIPTDWVINAIPPIGTAVWQLKGHEFQVVRTSHIGAIHGFRRPGIGGVEWPGDFIAVRLFPSGPRPGEPVGGDSGSLCFVRHRGKWQVLGICNTAGHCHLPFWDIALSTNKGSVINPRATVSTDTEGWSKIWMEQNEPTITIMRELYLPTPPTTRRVVGMLKEGDDGTDNVVLDVSWSGEVKTLEVLGAGTNRWFWPDNGRNWIIRAAQVAPETLRFWFKAASPGETYVVRINGFLVKIVAVPDLGGAPPVQPVPAPVDSSDDLAEAEAEIIKLTTELEVLKDELHDAIAARDLAKSQYEDLARRVENFKTAYKQL